MAPAEGFGPFSGHLLVGNFYFAAGPEGETHGLFGSIKAGRSLY